MKMNFSENIPYIFEQWAKVVARSPSSAFIGEELSGRSYTRQQVDELSARVCGWLRAKGIGAEDFVMIRFPRDACFAIYTSSSTGKPKGVLQEYGKIKLNQASYRKKIEQKIMLPLEVRFVQPQTFALYRDMKILDGASPNQIKPIHVISNEN